MKLNVDKCKEMITDFSKKNRNFTPLQINDVPVKRLASSELPFKIIWIGTTT
jgi:hypothetical protein